MRILITLIPVTFLICFVYILGITIWNRKTIKRIEKNIEGKFGGAIEQDVFSQEKKTKTLLLGFNSGEALAYLTNLIVAFAAVAALFNTSAIEVKISSLQASLEEIYSKQVVEIFSASDAVNFEILLEASEIRYLKIPLKEVPIKGSVTLWFAGAVQSPDWYKIEGKTLLLKLAYSNEDIKSLLGSATDYNPIIVSYLR